MVDKEGDEMNNILQTIKKMLGIDGEYTAFDVDIIVNINTALMTLSQIGVGKLKGFSIVTGEETWSDFLEENQTLQAAKTFIYFTVRLAFDPPSSAYLVESYTNQLRELSWRLSVQAEEPLIP